MTMVEIGLASGYAPIEKTILDLSKEKRVDGISKQNLFKFYR